MPTFNVESYVAAAIGSILKQTHKNLELIVQDDGSSDGTVAVLRRLAEEDSRIVVLEPFEKNRGVIAARNALLERVRGEYVAWMDSDDGCRPDRLAIQLAFLEANPEIGAVGTAIEYADESLIPYRREKYSKDPKRQAVDPEICCATVMARRDAVIKAGPFRDAFFPGGEDGDWILKLADHYDVTNIDDVLYTYRQHMSTTKRGTPAIRRLGVLARFAARERRAGRPDPIDGLKPDPRFDYLRDDVFLSWQGLTPEEKVTALSLPLPDHPRLISVLIPYYNAHDYIEQCLQHLAAQYFRNFEVLVHDDGSSPAFDQAAARAALGDVPLKSTRTPKNRGAAFARNRLLEAAKSPLLVWQDADDYSREDRLEKLLGHLLANPDCKAVGSAINYVQYGIVSRSEDYPEQAVTEAGFHGCCATFMLRRSAALEVGTFREDLTQASEDVDFLRRIRPESSVVNIPDILYYYRRHEEQTTQKPEWIDAQTYYLLQALYEHYGLKSQTFSEQPSRAEYRAHIDAYFRLRKVALDRTQFGDMYLRLMFRDVREGRLSYWNLIPLAARFPLSMVRQVTSFAAHRIGFARAKSAAVADPAAGSAPQRKSSVVVAAEAAPVAAPVVQARPARVIARCFDNWGDFDDALAHLTPGGNAIWGDVAFVRNTPVEPDWYVVFNHPGAAAVEIEASPNRVLYAIGEPPTFSHRPLHIGQGAGTTVLTCDDELVRLNSSTRRHVLTPCMTRTWSVKKTYEELRQMEVKDKPRQLSWVTSNLALIAGHKYRLAFLERLRGAVEFDLFGRGFKPIENKWDGIAPYRYSIAFENTRAPYYFTEKLMDCFVAETMPIYYGSPIITEFFPAESMVILDPEDPDALRKIKDVAASDLWKRNREAILEAKRLTLEKYNIFAHIARMISEAADEPLAKTHMKITPVEVHLEDAA